MSEDITNIYNNSSLTTILNGLKLEFMETICSKLKLTKNHELFAYIFLNIKTKWVISCKELSTSEMGWGLKVRVELLELNCWKWDKVERFLKLWKRGIYTYETIRVIGGEGTPRSNNFPLQK